MDNGRSPEADVWLPLGVLREDVGVRNRHTLTNVIAWRALPDKAISISGEGIASPQDGSQ
jgi:hypothetical protein